MADSAPTTRPPPGFGALEDYVRFVDACQRADPTLRFARTVAAGHAFVQNLRRGRYELAIDALAVNRLAHFPSAPTVHETSLCSAVH